MPKRSRDVYAFGKVAFVQVASGLWIRTDVCVLKVACLYCGAPQFEPCMSVTWVDGNRIDGGPVAWNHYGRRRAAAKLKLPGHEVVREVVRIHVGVTADRQPA